MFASLPKKNRNRNIQVAWLHGYKYDTEIFKVQVHGFMKMIKGCIAIRIQFLCRWLHRCMFLNRWVEWWDCCTIEKEKQKYNNGI